MAVTPRVAVLIDGENISADVARKLFDEINKIGKTDFRRVYGHRDQLQGWPAVQAQYQIKSGKIDPNNRQKDIADVALITDAIKLLHLRKFDTFCIVSSDSGFAALAKYIRHKNKRAYGFGEHKAPERLRKAYNQYSEL